MAAWPASRPPVPLSLHCEVAALVAEEVAVSASPARASPRAQAPQLLGLAPQSYLCSWVGWACCTVHHAHGMSVDALATSLRGGLDIPRHAGGSALPFRPWVSALQLLGLALQNRLVPRPGLGMRPPLFAPCLAFSKLPPKNLLACEACSSQSIFNTRTDWVRTLRGSGYGTNS